MTLNRRSWLAATTAIAGHTILNSALATAAANTATANAVESDINGASEAAESANAAQTTKRLMTIDLVCGAIGVTATQVAAIEYASKFGFESVEARADYLATLDAAGAQAIQADMKERKLAWGAAGLPVEFRQDEDRFATDLKKLPSLAAGLQRAGVTRVGTWLRPTHETLTYTQNMRQHVRRLREAGKILHDHDLRFGLEYVSPKTSWTAKPHPFIHSLAELRDLLAEINLTNTGVVLDSWHWYNASETTAEILSLTNKDVIAVDLNDAPAGLTLEQQMDLSRELPAATGVIDVAAFLKSLMEIGYDGPVRAEPFNAELRKLPPDNAVAATAAAMRKAFSLVSIPSNTK